MKSVFLRACEHDAITCLVITRVFMTGYTLRPLCTLKLTARSSILPDYRAPSKHNYWKAFVIVIGYQMTNIQIILISNEPIINTDHFCYRSPLENVFTVGTWSPVGIAAGSLYSMYWYHITRLTNCIFFLPDLAGTQHSNIMHFWFAPKWNLHLVQNAFSSFLSRLWKSEFLTLPILLVAIIFKCPYIRLINKIMVSTFNVIFVLELNHYDIIHFNDYNNKCQNETNLNCNSSNDQIL
jgi:hypothetical protein